MIYAKNYKTVTKFVKVMPRILWPLFSWTRCRLTMTWTRTFRTTCATSYLRESHQSTAGNKIVAHPNDFRFIVLSSIV